MLKNILILAFSVLAIFVQAQNKWNIDTIPPSELMMLRQYDTIPLLDWSIKINELCAINETILKDDFGEYDDWVEIYNFGEDTIDLKGIYITDDISQPQKFQFPETILVLPKTFALIWADGQPQQGGKHIGFKLSGDGEEIALFSPDSVLMIDSRVFDEQTVDISFGRQPDGGSIWNYFDEPTPGSSNLSSGLLGVTPIPEFSLEGGFYQDAFAVEISVDLDSVLIYYTLDCSEPTATSSLYSAPININANTVLRARAFREGWVAGPIATATYIFDPEYSLNVISLVTQSDNLWGSSGIYENQYSGLEKPVHFEYFTENGDPAFNIDLGVKIHSPDSRQQKSLRFYARSQYGDNEINYQLFNDISITKFKRLILRNAGNDGFELKKTNIRDPLSHIIYGQSNPENAVAASKPVDVYINGQYWGIYNMRERQDEHYIESHYDETDIDFIEYDAQSPSYKHIIKGNWDNFDSLKSFVMNNDLSIESNYRHVESWMDIENFVDYQILEIFVGNQDWLSNNMKFWRPKRPDGKWKWVLWDTEYGLGLFYPNHNIGYPDFNTLLMALTWGGWGSGDYTYLLRNLVENQEFLEYFNIRFADLLNTDYKENGNIVNVIDSLQLLLASDAERQFNRWGSNNSTWVNMVQGIKNFTNPRPYYCRQHIIDQFELDTLFNLSLNISPPEAGIIEVNTISVDAAEWEGQYFTDYSTSLKAVPNRGYHFIGWEGLEADTSVLQLVALGDTSLTAIFQLNPPDTSIIINEINYNSAAFFDPGDWVEIKNIAASKVDLAGWIFKDENDEHIFEIPENTELLPEEFLVLCVDSVQFSSNFPELSNFIGNLGFSFSGGGEVLRLYDSNGVLVDSVHYDDNFPWPELADGIGPSLELIADSANNNWPQNWRASFVVGGTPGSQNSCRDTVSLFINEFMADNDNTISDEQGEFEDWIELYNAGGQYVNVGGMYITDDLNNPLECQISDNSLDSTMILPGEFLLLWADKDASDGVRHLGIKLSASGEQIGLFANDGATVIDALTFAAQQTDISFGRRVNGGANWLAMNNPTPAESNTSEIVVALKVFLEGAFNGTEMNTSTAYQYFPFIQPYHVDPWNYNGPEEVSGFPNMNITDWILVELRDATNSSLATQNSAIIQQVGFLLNDGTVCGIDGYSDLKFDVYFNDSLYAVIKHRNHLDVMTNYALQNEDGHFTCNLTESAEQVFGGALAVKEIAPNIWAMYSGDAFSDGEVNQFDRDSVWVEQAGKSAYIQGDLNLDSQINNEDKNRFWFPNVGTKSRVPQ